MDGQDLAAVRRAFAPLSTIPDDEWRFLEERAVLRQVPKGSALLREGELVDWLGYLTRGLVRIVRRVGGREVTLGFDCEERFVGAYDAYVTRTPARYGIEALEPSRCVRFERGLLDALEGRHACWRELFRRIAERELVRKLDKELRIRTRTSEERYAELVRRGSYLVRRVPQYHMASFLGIAPETLSRIRARMGSRSTSVSRARS